METPGSEMWFNGCGEILRDERQKAGLSLRELAERADCNHSHLSKMENNTLAVSLSMIEQIAKGLEVKSEKLVLKCLETRFPKMRTTKAGKAVAQYLSSVKRDDR